MKALTIIAFIFLSAIYLSPDFDRLLNSLPLSINYNDNSIQTNAGRNNSKPANTNFRRRRFIPPVRTNENAKLSSTTLPKINYQPNLNEFAIIICDFNIYYISITFVTSGNKAPPLVYC
jgi:hypothetical protein